MYYHDFILKWVKKQHTHEKPLYIDQKLFSLRGIDIVDLACYDHRENECEIMSTPNRPFKLELDAYVESIQRLESPTQLKLRQQTSTHQYKNMQVTRDQGALLSWLVSTFQAKLIIEVGVFTGYSSLCMAEAMSDDGKIIACDINAEWVNDAIPFWEQAGCIDKIDLRIGPGQKTLEDLIATGMTEGVDFIFIDADKTGYPAYYELAIALLRPGGILVFDNMFLMGRILTDGPDKKTAQALRKLNTFIQSDSRVSMTVLPLNDGMTLIQKKA